MRISRNVIAAIIFVFCLALSAPSALASESGGNPELPSRAAACVGSSQVEQLLRWIGAHTRYDVSLALADPPRITYCSLGMTIDYEDRDLVVERPLVAFYDKKQRHIFLVEPWDPKSPQNLSTLLHELVHDVQHLNRDWPCWGKAEWEAYKLQETWLIEQGEEPQLNWADIFLQSLCPRDVHP